MKNLFALLLTAIAAIGCAGSVEPASAEESLVTYTVIFDVGSIETNLVRIMPCDIATGMCELDEPEGCRFFDEAGATGHACDITVAESEPLAFNIQLDSVFACSTNDEACARYGDVHVLRDGVEVDHLRDVHGEFCNFLVTPASIAIPTASEPDGI